MVGNQTRSGSRLDYLIQAFLTESRSRKEELRSVTECGALLFHSRRGLQGCKGSRWSPYDAEAAMHNISWTAACLVGEGRGSLIEEDRRSRRQQHRPERKAQVVVKKVSCRGYASGHRSQYRMLFSSQG